MIAEIPHRHYASYNLYRSCLPIYGIAAVSLLSFLFIDDFERNANISVAIKSGSTVCHVFCTRMKCKHSQLEVTENPTVSCRNHKQHSSHWFSDLERPNQATNMDNKFCYESACAGKLQTTVVEYMRAIAGTLKK